MAKIQTTNPIEQGKIVKERAQEVGIAVKPFTSKELINILVSAMLKMRLVTNELKIGYASINELLTIVDYYNKHNEGISQCELCKLNTMLNNSVIVYDRCKRLVKLGHIECVGRSKRGSPIYIPTFKSITVIQRHFALTELQSLVDSYSLGRTA